ncbi:molybdopterin-dependent oxidoreductase [Nocardioides convexus]|uniref:molybdopterin-dependent oxidoreductase n=1 Tax=Nocardioides convexus TaxID=2712224 RepID=UPI003101095C
MDRGLPFPLVDVESTDVLVLVGSNLAETMPPAARHLDRLRERGGKVVVIDPRRTPTAERADLFVQPVPGTDLALALGGSPPAGRPRRRRRGVRRDANHRLRGGPPLGGRLVARAGGAGVRRGHRGACARWPTCSPTRAG